MSDNYSYILMKDVQGEKHPSSMAGKVFSAFSGGSKPVQVLRGELLRSIPRKHVVPRTDGRPAHNFHSWKDPSITLYGGKDDEYVSPLIGTDLDLLEAIKKPYDRFAVFYEGDKVEWGGRLAKGDHVYVMLPGDNSSNPTWSAAMVQYAGQVEGAPGKVFGVEIKEPRYLGRGSSDGFFGGYKYFECGRNCSLFVSLDKLAKEDPNQVPPPTAHAAHSATEPAGRYNFRSSTKQASAKDTPVDRQQRFQMNDRVAVYDKKNQAKYGVVRWIGTDVGTRKLESTYIGIETDEVAVTNYFPHALTGTGHLFNGTPGHRLVVPEEFVFKEELARSRPQADNIDVSNPVDVAREFGLTQHELMAQQQYGLKEAQKTKKKEDKEKARADSRRSKKNGETASDPQLQEVKDTLHESIDLREQQRIMAEIEKEKAEKDKEKVQKAREEQARASQQLRANASSHHSGQGTGHHIQKQSSWHSGDNRPGSNHYEPMPGMNSPGKQGRQDHHDNRGGAAANTDHERVHEHQKYLERQQRNQQGGSPQNLRDDKHRVVVQQANVDTSGHPHSQPGNTRPGANQQFAPDQHGMRRNMSRDRLENEDPDYQNVDKLFEQEQQRKHLQEQTQYGVSNPQLPEYMQQGHDPRYSNMPPGGANQGGYPYNQEPRQPQRQDSNHYNVDPTAAYHGGGYSAHYNQQQQHQGGNDRYRGQPPTQQPQPTWEPAASEQPPTQQYAHKEPSASVDSSNHYNLGIGSAVQVASMDPNEPHHYGVIRWTGYMPGIEGQVAGIELDEYMEGCTDGTFKPTGEKKFSCTYGRGLYFPLGSLTPDMRFGSVTPQTGRPATAYDNPVQAELEEQVDQFIGDAGHQMWQYIGNEKGIQGHQNSCYLDSTIFGLFALNDVFDTMFLEPDQSVTSDENRRAVSEQLWKGIVNPLRKNGVVRYESVMAMRNKLEELGKMEGITEKEKDPEEFLNMLFKHVLHTKPFISIKRPFGVEQEFFVQLFLEPDPNLRVPSVGVLLRKMFREQNISFTKVPSKLLIQVPRFGREFKAFEKIVPELKLNVRELTDSFKKATVIPCFICGDKAVINSSDGNTITSFCERCSHLYHNNPAYPKRVEHTHSKIEESTGPTDDNDDGQVAELDLLSVICIETSHYVCFTRDPRDSTERKWIFFDSMADRKYDTYNIPRVMDCSRELNEWVYSGDRTRLMSTQPRQLPDLVRRFTQDIYMCVYIQPDVAMYGDADDDDNELSRV